MLPELRPTPLTPLPAVLPDSIGELQALTYLRLDGNEIAGTCFCVVPGLRLTTFCNTDAEKARVKAALPNCSSIYF